MNTSNIVKASFIPAKDGNTLWDLSHSFKQIQDTESELLMKNLKTRSNLAKKINYLRNRLLKKIKIQIQQRENQLLKDQLSELAEHVTEIKKSCYRDALNTIKTVCLKVFSENTAAYDSILQLSLDKAFNELDPAKIIQAKLPQSILNKYQQCNFKCLASEKKQAIVVTSAGNIIVDPILELENGFVSLQHQLEEILK